MTRNVGEFFYRKPVKTLKGAVADVTLFYALYISSCNSEQVANCTVRNYIFTKIITLYTVFHKKDPFLFFFHNLLKWWLIYTKILPVVAEIILIQNISTKYGVAKEGMCLIPRQHLCKFWCGKLRGLGNTRGQILEFSIEMAGHPYNSAALPRSLWWCMSLAISAEWLRITVCWCYSSHL